MIDSFLDGREKGGAISRDDKRCAPMFTSVMDIHPKRFCVTSQHAEENLLDRNAVSSEPFLRSQLVRPASPRAFAAGSAKRKTVALFVSNGLV